MKATTLLKSLIFLSLLSAIAACGRAGPIQPPPASVAASNAVDDADETANDEPLVLDGLLN